jgi:N-acylneuraminate cytidylyltransferase
MTKAGELGEGARGVVAFVPARGGSKRLPRKNVLPFAGRPLLAHTIEQALATPLVERCVVSTDDAEIGAVARRFGAEVVERPARLATAEATTASAARHALEQLAAQGCRPSALLTLQPNCPLRPVSVVTRALELFAEQRPDSVVSVTRSHHKLGRIESGLFVPDYAPGTRSQDMAPRWFENGVVYVSRPELVLEREDLFGRRVVPLETDPLLALGDIDTELDFVVAEHLFVRYAHRFAIGAAAAAPAPREAP